MKKSELLRYAGSIQQVAYARRIRYYDGRSDGLNAVEVCNGLMSFVVMLDKCMDISELTWRGERISFMGKTGLNGRNPFDTHGLEAQRSIMGGLFFTCGFENICAPYTADDGKEYPMHGRMRTSPAEHVSVNAAWNGDKYEINISGDIREAELFGENLLLHRTIHTTFGEPEIRITDEIYNEAFRDEPMLLMYHCNFGYPFLTEKTRLILPTRQITARDDVSSKGIERYHQMETPVDNAEEMVYLHTLASNENGQSFAALVNDERELGIKLSFNHNALPEFGQWKSICSGDYVMGLEPSNVKIYGRKYAEAHSELPILSAQSKATAGICFRIVEGKEGINKLDIQAKNMKGQIQNEAL